MGSWWQEALAILSGLWWGHYLGNVARGWVDMRHLAHWRRTLRATVYRLDYDGNMVGYAPLPDPPRGWDWLRHMR